MKKIIAVLLSVWMPFAPAASLSPEEKIVEQAKASRSIEEFVKKLELPSEREQETLEVVKKRVPLDSPMPKMKLLGSTIVVSNLSDSVTFDFSKGVSGILSVNGREIKFKLGDRIENLAVQIERAYAKTSQTSLFEFLVPRAEAIEPVVTTVLVVAGIVGISAWGWKQYDKYKLVNTISSAIPSDRKVTLIECADDKLSKLEVQFFANRTWTPKWAKLNYKNGSAEVCDDKLVCKMTFGADGKLKANESNSDDVLKECRTESSFENIKLEKSDIFVPPNASLENFNECCRIGCEGELRKRFQAGARNADAATAQ